MSKMNGPTRAFPQAPAPKSPLGRYRLLSPTAGVRVSPLCLGSMNFGTAWREWMGSCDQKTVEKILDFYYEQGGNFIDTANNYQFEQAETWIGEWMKKRGNRSEIVLATKYTTCFKVPTEGRIAANHTGNSTKSMRLSVDASLYKLNTSYVDILYVHWWDSSTSIPELMQSLNHLVANGKVLYLGASDTPAWVVAKANQYARDHALRQFSVYQGRWSAACRDVERDILPMCREEGMAIAPWGTLGGGAFKTEAERQEQQRREQRSGARGGRAVQASNSQIKVSRILEMIARRKGTRLTSVALAYVLHKTPYVFPVVGGRTVDHLKENIEALTLELHQTDLDEIEGAVSFDPGFPHSFLFGCDRIPPHPAQVWLLNVGGTYDYVPLPRPILPPKSDE